MTTLSYKYFITTTTGVGLIEINDPGIQPWEGYEFGLDSHGCITTITHHRGRLGQECRALDICQVPVKIGQLLTERLLMMIPDIRRKTFETTLQYGMTHRVGIARLFEEAMA